MSNALIVIDMQEGFRYPNTETIIPKINELAKKFNGKVFFTKFVDTPNSFFDKTLEWKKFQKGSNQEFLHEIIPSGNIISHSGYSISLDLLIQFEKVYIAGIYLDVSVTKLALDLFDAGITPVIIKNCTTAQDSRNDSVYIDSLSRMIGEQNIITLEDI